MLTSSLDWCLRACVCVYLAFKCKFVNFSTECVELTWSIEFGYNNPLDIHALNRIIPNENHSLETNPGLENGHSA